MSFKNGTIVVVDEEIKYFEHLGTGWVANYYEFDNPDGKFKLQYDNRNIYCSSSERSKIHEINAIQLINEMYNNTIHWLNLDTIPPTKQPEPIEDTSILHTSFDTNNSENDSIIVKSFADNSAVIRVETLEENTVCSLEFDLPFSAVKKLKSALDAIIDLEGVNK